MNVILQQATSVRQNHVHHVLAEKALLEAVTSPLFVRLRASFQDEWRCYLIMVRTNLNI
jgi:hypothetical protein